MVHFAQYDLVVVGGGAAGFFGAINAKEANPSLRVCILERTQKVLSKVRISGGGRCNVTHACFDVKELVKNYPRGSKELIGPFSSFQPLDTVHWFETHGVKLKTEDDGRMFPITDSSETIISCFMRLVEKLQIDLLLGQDVEEIVKLGNQFILTVNGEKLTSRYLLLATGSLPKGLQLAKQFGHTLVDPVPSLFTFNVPDSPLSDLAGISVDPAEISFEAFPLKQKGPLLITHWGFSGPAVLKLSAFGAKNLHDLNYETQIKINFVPQLTVQAIKEKFSTLKKQSANRKVSLEEIVPLPKNLAKRLLHLALQGKELRYAELSNSQLEAIIAMLTKSPFSIKGKTTYKQEFVTCGGILLKEVDFKKMESKLVPGLFFAGEILNIDGITGGFNFQNAWTTSWLASQQFL